MKRRLITLLLAVALLATLAPTFALAEPDPLPMRWIVPGAAKYDDEMVEEALYEALKADGLNIKPELIYYNWDVWEQKTNVMFAAGDEFEMIHTMDNGAPSTVTLIAKNAIVPLDDLIKQYGQDMYNLFPQSAWDQATLDGQIMAIPAPWIDMSAEHYMAMRQDMLDKYSLKQPDTLPELLDAMKTIQQGELQETGTYWYIDLRPQGNVGLFTPLQRGIEGYPFKIVEMMAMIREDGSVESYLESPQFKQYCDFIYEANQAGLIYPDLLSMDTGSYAQPTERGNMLASDRKFGGIEKMLSYDPNVKMANFLLNSAIDNTRYTAYPNCNTVSATSPHPETAVQFMNWLYSAQEHMDLLIYGIEGKHWINEGERQFSLPEYNINGVERQSQYGFGFWMTGWAPYQRFDKASDWKASAEYEFSFHDEVKDFISSGFVFSPANVASEYANCQSVLTTYINPIVTGFQKYDESMPSALQRMKDAGLDKVVAECQKQFAEFLAAK